MAKNVLDLISEERIREHILVLEGVRHPVVAPEALQEAADYVHATLDALDFRVEPHSFSEGARQFRNIVATRLGASRPEERLLVIAHYDTVENSPGADDNASGVAVLLELARVLEQVELDRTVQLIAVNLEERQREGAIDEAGLVGSRALAADAEKQGWQIVGVIVLECIAYVGKVMPQEVPEGIAMQIPESADFVCLVGNEASKGLVEGFVQAVERHQIPLPVLPVVVPGNGEVLPDTRRSDHAPFWDRGYKALMVTDTANIRNPNYHQPTDRLETLDLSFAANVGRAVAGMVLDAARCAPTP